MKLVWAGRLKTEKPRVGNNRNVKQRWGGGGGGTAETVRSMRSSQML